MTKSWYIAADADGETWLYDSLPVWDAKDGQYGTPGDRPGIAVRVTELCDGIGLNPGECKKAASIDISVDDEVILMNGKPAPPEVSLA